MDPDKHVEVERGETLASSRGSMDSDCSMEPLSHSELDEWITYLGIDKEGLESRPPSCVSMNSVGSMDLPLHFRESWTPEFRVEQERVESPAPICLSVKSDRSMDPPLYFKRESWTPEFSELVSSLLSEDHFRCYVCSKGLREPVTIPCGHSYCGQCISTYWAQPSHAGDYQCPQCSKSFPTRLELSTNIALFRVLQVLQQACFSPVLPAVAHAGAGDVACDICWGPKLRAVKTCVTCSASYCESHVRQHYTVPALQRHTLTQVTGDQRHSFQQNSFIDTKFIKEEVSLKRQREEEEMEDRGQSPKMRKMQLKEEEDASKGSPDELRKRDWELRLKNFQLSDIEKKLELKNAELKNICEEEAFEPDNLRQTLMATQEVPKRQVQLSRRTCIRASISDDGNLPLAAPQDLLGALRTPRSPQQLQRVLDILRSNPPLMAAFLAFRASKYKGRQGPSEAGVAGGGPSPAGRM